MSRRAPVSVRDLVRQATVLLAGEDETTELREAAINKNCKKEATITTRGGTPVPFQVQWQWQCSADSEIDFVDDINLISTTNVLFILVFGASSIFLFMATSLRTEFWITIILWALCILIVIVLILVSYSLNIQ